MLRTADDLRALRDGARVCFTGIIANLDDDDWVQILGHVIAVPGGAELRGRREIDDLLEGLDDEEVLGDDALIPLSLHHRAWPQGLQVLTRLDRLRASSNPCMPGSSPNSEGDPPSCHHPVCQPDCHGCFARTWRSRAEEAGLIEPDLDEPGPKAIDFPTKLRDQLGRERA